MMEIGSHASGMLELLDQYAYFRGQAELEQDAAVRTSYEESAELAWLQIELIAEEPVAAEQLSEVITYTPPVDADVEVQRRLLEKLLTSESRSPLVSKDSILHRLQALPMPEDHPRETRDSARFLLSIIANASEVIPVPTPRVPDSEQPAEAADQTDSRPEQDSGQLAITVFKDGVLKFPDGTLLSLHPTTLGLTRDTEEAITNARLAALRFLANNPGKRYSNRELWEAVMSPEEPFVGHKALARYGDFFREELRYQDQPLVMVDDSTPRRLYYSSAVELNLLESDEHSGLQPEFFALPDGTLLSARESRLAFLLLNASPEHPVGLAEFDAANILSPEDVASLKSPEARLSNLANTLRARFRQVGVDHLYIIHTDTDPQKRNDSGRQQALYWMEQLTLDPEQQLDRGTLRDAAAFFWSHHDRLKKLGLQPELSPKILQVLQARAGTPDSERPPQEELKAAFLRMTNHTTVERMLSSFNGLDPDDPDIAVISLAHHFADDPTLILQLESYPASEGIWHDDLLNCLGGDMRRHFDRLEDTEQSVVKSIFSEIHADIAQIIEQLDAHHLLTRRGSIAITELREYFGDDDFPHSTAQKLDIQRTIMLLLRRDGRMQQLDREFVADKDFIHRWVGRIAQSLRELYLRQAAS